MTCVTRAWLTLPDGRSVEFEGPSWFCTKLDLGSPEVRDVVTNRPDADGVDDRSQFLGSRLVSADVTALSTVANGRIDEISSAFAPFMHPAYRPTLHYILDRGANEERTMELRSAGFSAPIEGPYQRDIHLQWVAPDSFAYGAVEKSAQSSAGEAQQPGREYPLTFPRDYVTGGVAPTMGQIRTMGDVPARPMLRIFGPVTQPRVNIEVNYPDGSTSVQRVWFVSTFRIDAGAFVEVDIDDRTAYVNGDQLAPALRYLDWANVIWPAVPPDPCYGTLQLAGASTSHTTQVVATWHDGFLS